MVDNQNVTVISSKKKHVKQNLKLFIIKSSSPSQVGCQTLAPLVENKTGKNKQNKI